MNAVQGTQNTYLGEVLEQQVKVDQELRHRSQKAPSAPPAAARWSFGAPGAPGGGEPVVRAIDYRITGFWRWRTVIVPPNVYVVHTRRGFREPVTIGLGISFAFNPYTDAFLLIPAAMQTIVINARCICTERQGILVQAYVQWIIDDLTTAYRRLDFSDPADPMRIVNVQLREQAEAVIKDKVSTLSIDQVLADKEPIVEELTHRLRLLAEGNRTSDPLRSCTIITTTPNDTMAQIHDRMPVILPPSAWDEWLDPDNDDIETLGKLLVPAPPEVTVLRPVSTEVNNVRNKGTQLADEIHADQMITADSDPDGKAKAG